MSDQEPAEDQPSLELPSLGGWRRKRRGKRVAEEPVETVAEAPPPAPAPEPAPQPAPAPEPEPAPVARVDGEQTTVVLTETVADAPPPAEPRARRVSLRAPSLPRPTGWPAVVVTGVLVGLAILGLTWASLRTCEQVQGTTSCGTAGYPMLTLVLALAVLAGGALLRLAQAPDPFTTSFLGVGLAAVLALLFLVDRLDQPAMVVVIPAITAATFAAAHWLTTTFIEPGDRPR